MKNSLLFLLLLLPLFVSAQSSLKGLPVDSATGKIMYEQVVQVPGATKQELYARARAWAATEFRSAKDVLQMDDKESGVLIAKGFAEKSIPSAGRVVARSNKFWRTIKVQVKDGRYRYEITDFEIESPYENGTMERRIEAAANAPFSGGKTGSPKGHYKYLLESVAETTAPEIASLQKSMNGSGKLKDF